VIRLTRLNSQDIVVNSDLIKYLESNPDTVLTLVSGDKILVQESADEVIARVIEFRRAVIGNLLSISADHALAIATGGTAHKDRTIPPSEGTVRG
jgi:flagellar protein FlbD